MKIEHRGLGCFYKWVDGYSRISPNEVPHECSVPDCPGDLNRRKLELFGEMLINMEALSRAEAEFTFPNQESITRLEDAFNECNRLIAKAKELK